MKHGEAPGPAAQADELEVPPPVADVVVEPVAGGDDDVPGRKRLLDGPGLEEDGRGRLGLAEDVLDGMAFTQQEVVENGGVRHSLAATRATNP